MLSFSKEMYPKIALVKSAYAFTEYAYVHLDSDEKYYFVEIKPKKGYKAVTEDEFINEMLCQCVRHEIYNQTKSVRELLLAKALASTVIEKPQASNEFISQNETTDDEKQILTDWFERYDDSET